jgi:calcium-dependent protein kinase
VREAALTGHDRSVAIKSVSKEKVKGNLMFLKRELDVMRAVDHPNLIKYYEAYEDEKYIHIVMELCTGGDLLDRIMALGSINERQVCVIMRKLLRAVMHLHELNITHRDLKPDNFLFASKDPESEVKIIDFGMSIQSYPLMEMTSFVGTPYYLAPEVITGGYGPQCDVWSLGVVMFLLLSGQQPFEGSSVQEIMRKIVLGNYGFSESSWNSVSRQAKDLISRMLTLSPYKRILLKEALNHSWFLEDSLSPKLPMAVLLSIKRFKAPKKLQKEVMRIMIKFLSAEDIEDLKHSFLQIDRERTGFVTIDDLESAMLNAGLELPLEEVKSTLYIEILRSLDSDSLGKIKYSDFLMATLDKKKLIDAELMFLTFQHFDVDGDGYINAHDLKRSLETVGDASSIEDIEGMISEWDLDNNRRIDFQEFRRLVESLHEPPSARTDRRPSTKRVTAAKRTLAKITAPLDDK